MANRKLTPAELIEGDPVHLWIKSLCGIVVGAEDALARFEARATTYIEMEALLQRILNDQEEREPEIRRALRIGKD